MQRSSVVARSGILLKMARIVASHSSKATASRASRCALHISINHHRVEGVRHLPMEDLVPGKDYSSQLSPIQADRVTFGQPVKVDPGAVDSSLGRAAVAKRGYQHASLRSEVFEHAQKAFDVLDVQAPSIALALHRYGGPRLAVQIDRHVDLASGAAEEATKRSLIRNNDVARAPEYVVELVKYCPLVFARCNQMLTAHDIPSLA
jgi:hypothetical protein